ncbi:MAG: RDD family protein, partial [Actinomycetota bacterium]|nr:RDD family protein [Actinomycetota bacterium]
HVLAGWWRRAGAALIDGLIVGAAAVAVMAPLGVGFFSADSGGGAFAAIAGLFIAALVLTIIGFLYAPLLMARTNGQTLGRMATGIRVIRTNGQRMSFGWAMLREVAVKGLLINAVAGSATFGLVTLLDYLWPLWDEENRALHDFLVQTRTVLAQS